MMGCLGNKLERAKPHFPNATPPKWLIVPHNKFSRTGSSPRMPPDSSAGGLGRFDPDPLAGAKKHQTESPLGVGDQRPLAHFTTAPRRRQCFLPLLSTPCGGVSGSGWGRYGSQQTTISPGRSQVYEALSALCRERPTVKSRHLVGRFFFSTGLDPGR